VGPVSEQRLMLVHPVLAKKIRKLEVNLGVLLGVTQGLRTNAEQDALFAQGRDPVELVNQKRVMVGWLPILMSANKIVTNARGGWSWHNMALAVDVVPDDVTQPGFQADWNESHPVWKDLVQKGQALGLTSGISWKDEPHFQLTGKWPATPTDEVRQILAQSGMKAVWDASGIVDDGGE
jgi:peptidoglycan L-alanyl-D-glutamate endopeptidase CwlK